MRRAGHFICSGQTMKDMQDEAGDLALEALLEDGAAKVKVEVESVNVPDMGQKVGTPDGPGEVAWPTTRMDCIMVSLDDGGRKGYPVGVLSW